MNQQLSINNAFNTLRQLYDEGVALFDSAKFFFDIVGLKNNLTVFAFQKSLRNHGWPFIYLQGKFFYPAPRDSKAGFIAISFHDNERTGPYLLGGIIESQPNAKLNVWQINSTARRPRYEGLFDVVTDGPLYMHTISTAGQAKEFLAGVQRVVHFEIPLTTITSSAYLHDIVNGVANLRTGDDKVLRDLLKDNLAVLHSTGNDDYSEEVEEIEEEVT